MGSNPPIRVHIRVITHNGVRREYGPCNEPNKEFDGVGIFD